VTAQRRYENFFRGTGRDRDPQIAYDSLESQALNIVRESIVAHALSMRRTLSPADLDRMLSAAQSQLRGMSPEDLRGISPSSAVLKTITDASFAAAPVADPQTRAALIAATANDPAAGTEPGNTYAARMLRLDIERAQRAASSNRYEGMSGSDRLSQGDLQNIAAARSLARDLGMSWAANNQELLRLGPSAIKTLHEAGVQRERFERMTGGRVGFRAGTAVDIAAFAKRHNLTPEQTNGLYDRINNGVETISGGNRAIQRELDEATRRYVTTPDSPESRRALEDAYRRHADTPEKRRAAEDVTRALIAPTRQRDAAAIANLRTEQRTEADRQAALDGLDGPAPAAPVKHAEAPTGDQPQPSKVAVAPPVVQTAAIADDKKPGAKAPAAPKV
jgi:hypothetical protein